MGSLEPEPGRAADYDALRSQLVDACFEPVPGEKGLWEGPIFDSFKALASGLETMQIRIRDGFPYTFPKIYVEGIVSDHVAASNEVCMWEAGEDSWSWLTLEQIEARSVGWVKAHAQGFRPEDEVLDAHLYFVDAEATLALVDLSALRIEDEDKTDSLYGTWERDERALRLTRTRPGSAAVIEGRFYCHEAGVSVPPRNLDAFRQALSPRQQRNFDRRLDNVRKGQRLVTALFWDTAYGSRNALILLLSPTSEGEVAAKALEAAPLDLEYRLLRAGPDAEALQDQKALIFGVGAVGSHLAVVLAQCGLGAMQLVDNDILRPAHVTRHRGLPIPGWSKIQSVGTVVKEHAPWVDLTHELEAPWAPARIQELIDNADIIIDTTGSTRFAELLSIEAEKASVPMISAALYRQGAIGRIRRQAEGDTPIHARTDTDCR